MTQSASPLRKEHTGNGVATNFLYDWRIDANTQLLVTRVTISTGAEYTMQLGTDYTVTGVGSNVGGNVVTSSPLSALYRIVITPNLLYEQDTDFTNQNSVKPEEVESAMDKIVRQLKQLAEQVGRAVKTTVGSTLTPDQLIAAIINAAADTEAAKVASAASALSASNSAAAAQAAAAVLPKNNFSATTDPTANDDSGDGYSPGSQWLNTSTGDRFLCSNASVGAAVWQDVTGIAPEDLGSMAFEAAADYVLQSQIQSIRQIPQNSKSEDYTLVLADGGKHIFHPSSDGSGRTWTIPANASVAFPVGTAVTFVNQNGAGSISINITSDTMRLAGTGSSGGRTLAANGVATALKIDTTEWIISGTGLT